MSDSSSLDESLRLLKADLARGSGGIAAQSGLPFAILRYAPEEEYLARRKLRLFSHELAQGQFHVTFLSISKMVWRAVREGEGVKALFETERQYGFAAAEHREVHSSVNGQPSKSGVMPALSLASQILAAIAAASPSPDLLFLVRAGGLAPNAYRTSALLGDLHHGGLSVPTILCFPGSSIVGSDLRFYDLPGSEGVGSNNYRVKIYGTNG